MNSPSSLRPRPLIFAVLAALLLCLNAACNVVTAPGPVGDKPHALDEAKWNGYWEMRLDEDPEDISVFLARVTDPEAGELELTGLEENDGKLEASSLRVYVREIAGTDWLLASYEDEEAGDGRFFWGRIRITEDQVLAWIPFPDAFAEWVQQGILRGNIEDDGDVHLEAMNQEELAALASSEQDEVLFVWPEPLTFRRISRAVP